jgi:hypothetical protein
MGDMEGIRESRGGRNDNASARRSCCTGKRMKGCREDDTYLVPMLLSASGTLMSGSVLHMTVTWYDGGVMAVAMIIIEWR